MKDVASRCRLHLKMTVKRCANDNDMMMIMMMVMVVVVVMSGGVPVLQHPVKQCPKDDDGDDDGDGGGDVRWCPSTPASC